MTVLAQLVASNRDSGGYITYVFKCLEDSEYIMCTRFPNWDHRKINIGDKGFLSFLEIRAGIDTWFDGREMIPYKYNNIQFLKFVDIPEHPESSYVM